MNKYEYFADDDDGHDFAGTSDLAGIELAKRRAMEDLTDEELEDKLAADLSAKRNYASSAGDYDDFTSLEFESSGFANAQNYLNSESGGTKFNKSSKVKFKGRGDANLSAARDSDNSSGASYGDFAGANFTGRRARLRQFCWRTGRAATQLRRREKKGEKSHALSAFSRLSADRICVFADGAGDLHPQRNLLHQPRHRRASHQARGFA